MNDETDRTPGEWCEVARDILAERGFHYGDSRYNLLRIYKISRLLGVQLRDPSDLALVFIATKLSRSVESPGRTDTYLDLIGYSAILAQCRSGVDWDDIDTY